MTTTAPTLIYFPDGQVILAEQKSHDSYHVSDSGNRLLITGAYAHALSEFMNNSLSEESQKRLKILENYSWLAGLSRASLTPFDLSQMVLGKELGMLFVELTAQCNECCIHCYAESSPERTERLSIKEILSSLDQARSLGKPFVQFTGGDPLIHPNLVEAVAHAHQLDFAGIEIYTNGLLLSDALLEKLKPFAPDIAFSVYSHDAATHDNITKTPHSFKRTIEAIKRTQAAGLEIRIGVALMEENAAQLQDIRNFLVQDMDIHESDIRFDPVKKTGRGVNIENAEGITYSVAHLPDGGDPSERTGKLCIGYDGNIYPCIFSRQSPLGNIRDNTLQEMLDRLKQQSLSEPSAPRWQSCKDRLSCRDCQIIAYALGACSSG